MINGSAPQSDAADIWVLTSESWICCDAGAFMAALATAAAVALAVGGKAILLQAAAFH
jgi:hypothetical protein